MSMPRQIGYILSISFKHFERDDRGQKINATFDDAHDLRAIKMTAGAASQILEQVLRRLRALRLPPLR